MPLTDADLERIEARAKAATPGPWFLVPLPWRYPDLPSYVTTGSPDPQVGRMVLDGPEIDSLDSDLTDEEAIAQVDADLEFAACARTDVPVLLAEVRRLREELKRIGVQP